MPKSNNVKIQTPKRVKKSWGYELWIHNSSQYCGKLLVFPKSDSNFSMHFHQEKDESWYIQQGSFSFFWIDTKTGKTHKQHLSVGDVVDIQKGLPHQLVSLEDNSIVFEVSTEHFDYDSYRLYKHKTEDKS